MLGARSLNGESIFSSRACSNNADMKSRLLTCVGVSSGGSGASTSGGWTTTVNRGAAGGVADPDGAHRDHPDLTDAPLVQRLHRLDVLRPRLLQDPDGPPHLLVRKVGDELSEVAVVAAPVLVLDDDVADVGFRHDVDAEVPGADFWPGVGQTQSENGVEGADVGAKPRREIPVLRRPDVAERDRLDGADWHGSSLRAARPARIDGAQSLYVRRRHYMYVVVSQQPVVNAPWSGAPSAIRHRSCRPAWSRFVS